MPSGRLLLVTAETDLRQSLAFALEADGFDVTIRETPPARQWLVANRFDCTIVDQKAFRGADYEAIAFCIKAHPVVLMAERPHPWLTEWVSATLDLPLRGNEVATAVRHAMHIEA